MKDASAIWQNDPELAAIEEEYSTHIRTSIGRRDYDVMHAERAAIRERELKRTKELIEAEPISVHVINDNECAVSRRDMRERLRDGLRYLKAKGFTEIFLAGINIWTVLVVKDKADRFLFDENSRLDSPWEVETPTQVILRGVETGNGDSLSVYGEISTVKEGIWLLENEQWWDDGD